MGLDQCMRAVSWFSSLFVPPLSLLCVWCLFGWVCGMGPLCSKGGESRSVLPSPTPLLLPFLCHSPTPHQPAARGQVRQTTQQAQGEEEEIRRSRQCHSHQSSLLSSPLSLPSLSQRHVAP
jgi:hypothetical protein